MKMDNIPLQIVGQAVKFYRLMPIKALTPQLKKIYFRFLNSGGKRSLVIKEIEGVNFELDLTEVIDSAMYYESTREPDTSQALRKLCKPGSTVFDIGANVGSHALPMARDVGPQGRVYAFEPVPWAVNKLKRNLELNRFGNLVLESIALSDVNEIDVQMEFRASFKIGAGLGVSQDGRINSGWWNECDQIKIQMQTLDSYVSSHQITGVDLIKLDVDGFEGKVIRGALETLKRFHPIIIMEIAPAWTKMRGDNIADILQQLTELGYGFYTEVGFNRIDNIMDRINCLAPDGGFNVVASTRVPI